MRDGSRKDKEMHGEGLVIAKSRVFIPYCTGTNSQRRCSTTCSVNHVECWECSQSSGDSQLGHHAC